MTQMSTLNRCAVRKAQGLVVLFVIRCTWQLKCPAVLFAFPVIFWAPIALVCLVLFCLSWNPPIRMIYLCLCLPWPPLSTLKSIVTTLVSPSSHLGLAPLYSISQDQRRVSFLSHKDTYKRQCCHKRFLAVGSRLKGSWPRCQWGKPKHFGGLVLHNLCWISFHDIIIASISFSYSKYVSKW